eukprot:3150071-Pleurochrysis_carterae.AAC.1
MHHCYSLDYAPRDNFTHATSMYNTFKVISYGGTASCYRAVRSVVQGRPIRTTQAFIRRVPYHLIFNGTLLERPSGYGRASDC